MNRKETPRFTISPRTFNRHKGRRCANPACNSVIEYGKPFLLISTERNGRTKHKPICSGNCSDEYQEYELRRYNEPVEHIHPAFA